MFVNQKFKVAAILLAAASSVPLFASPLTSAADHLVSEQTTTGTNTGSWPGELDFTGSINAGLINAYVQTNSAAYKTAATSAGNFTIAYETGLGGGTPNYLGDETYSLSRLTTITGTATYAASAKTFYDSTVRGGTGSTAAYISNLEAVYGGEHSQPLIYLAYHTLAAYASNVNAIDKSAWRNATIQELGQITNSDTFPVESVGAALWAIASTGALDSTVINPTGGGLLAGTTLSSLPAAVARQQTLTSSDPGDFLYQLDNTAAALNLTEDTAYSILGLKAAQANNPVAYNYTAQLALAGNALAVGVDQTNGQVHQVLNDFTSQHLNLYNGELLQALPEPASLSILALGAAGVLQRRRRK